MTTRILLTAAAAIALAAGCEQTEPEATGTGASTGATGDATGGPAESASGSPAWLLTSAPEGAVDVGAAKQTAAEGEQIVLRGRIGGREDPISTDAPIFIIMDTGVPSCAEIEGDSCPTPWDYCCEPSESITANNATVQLVGEDGAPLAVNLDEQFDPLDEVIVTGVVAPRPNQQTLVVKATGVYRAGG